MRLAGGGGGLRVKSVLQMANMDWLRLAWDFLFEPWVRELAAVLTIVVFAYTFRSPIGRAVGRFWAWITRKLSGSLRRAYAFLGLATLKDLDSLREQLQQQTMAETGSSSSTEGGSSPSYRTIYRIGLRIDLDLKSWKHLGRTDPGGIGDREINALLQGPFCRQCAWRLQVGDFIQGIPVEQAWVHSKCPSCSLVWDPKAGPKRISSKDLKRFIYESLDAEMRLHGGIKDTDVPEKEQ